MRLDETSRMSGFGPRSGGLTSFMQAGLIAATSVNSNSNPQGRLPHGEKTVRT